MLKYDVKLDEDENNSIFFFLNTQVQWECVIKDVGYVG
jgi:hypothetical protein